MKERFFESWTKRPAWLVGLLAISLVGWACVPAEVSRARAKLKAGDLAGADRIVRSGLRSHSDSLDLWILRLRIDLLRGQRADAVQALTKMHDLATWHEWDRVRKMVLAHTIWEALGHQDAVEAGLRAARRHPFDSLKERLEGILQKGSTVHRAMAAGALLHEEPSVIDLLDGFSRSTDSAVRLEVARGLRPPWSSALWRIVSRLAADRDERIREAALAAAMRHAKKGDARVLSLLEAHLDDPSGAVRSQAAYGLKRLGPARLTLLASADPELAVRLAVLWGRRKDRAFVEQQLHSDKPFVALRAAVALWKQGLVGPDQVVLHWMGDGQWQIRAAACNAASVMKGSAVACKAVRRALADKERRVRAAACSAALHLGCAKTEAHRVCRGLAQGRDESAAAAAWELARRKDDFGLGRLEALASKPGPARSAAMRFLASLRQGLASVMSCWVAGPWSCRLQAAQLLYEQFRLPSAP